METYLHAFGSLMEYWIWGDIHVGLIIQNECYCYLRSIPKTQFFKQLFDQDQFIDGWGLGLIVCICTWSCHNIMCLLLRRPYCSYDNITNPTNVYWDATNVSSKKEYMQVNSKRPHRTWLGLEVSSPNSTWPNKARGSVGVSPMWTE